MQHNIQGTPPLYPMQARSSPSGRVMHSPPSQTRPRNSPYPVMHANTYARMAPGNSPMPHVLYEETPYSTFEPLVAIHGDDTIHPTYHDPSVNSYYPEEFFPTTGFPTGWIYPPTSTSSPYTLENDAVKNCAQPLASYTQPDPPYDYLGGLCPSNESPTSSDSLTPRSQPAMSLSPYDPASVREILSPETYPEDLAATREHDSSFQVAPHVGFSDASLWSMTSSAMGPLVPQSTYRPHTRADRQRYVHDVSLECPIDFWTVNSIECGIPLTDVQRGHDRRLQNGDIAVFHNRLGPSISIRLEWPGYRSWTRQIPTRDFRSPPNPITRAKLAKQIAKCVQRFILDRQDDDVQSSYSQWRVGHSADRIQFQDIVLVSVHHVSMGSWQPELRLQRPLH